MRNFFAVRPTGCRKSPLGLQDVIPTPLFNGINSGRPAPHLIREIQCLEGFLDSRFRGRYIEMAFSCNLSGIDDCESRFRIPYSTVRILFSDQHTILTSFLGTRITRLISLPSTNFRILSLFNAQAFTSSSPYDTGMVIRSLNFPLT